MKNRTAKTLPGMLFPFFTKHRIMVVAYAFIMYMIVCCSLSLLIAVDALKILSFGTFAVAVGVAAFLESKLLPRIYLVTRCRRICLYIFLFLYTCLHSVIRMVNAIDISTVAYAFLKTLFIGISCLIMIVYILVKSSKRDAN